MKISKIVSVALLSAGFYSAANANSLDAIQNIYEDTIALDHIVQKYIGKITADSSTGNVTDQNLISLVKEILNSKIDVKEGVNFGDYKIGVKDKVITIAKKTDSNVETAGTSVSLTFDSSTGTIKKNNKSNFDKAINEIFTKDQLTKNQSEKIDQTLTYVKNFRNTSDIASLHSDDIKDFLDIVEKAKDSKRAQATQAEIINDLVTNDVKTKINFAVNKDSLDEATIKKVDTFLDFVNKDVNDGDNGVTNQLLNLVKTASKGLLLQDDTNDMKSAAIKSAAKLLIQAIDAGYKFNGFSEEVKAQARTSLATTGLLSKDTKIGISAANNSKTLKELAESTGKITDANNIAKELAVLLGSNGGGNNNNVNAISAAQNNSVLKTIESVQTVVKADSNKILNQYVTAKFIQSIILGASDSNNILGKGVLLSGVSSSISDSKTALDETIEKLVDFKNLSSQNYTDIDNLISLVNNVDKNIVGSPTKLDDLKKYVAKVNEWIEKVNAVNIFVNPFEKITLATDITEDKINSVTPEIAKKISDIKAQIDKLNDYSAKLSAYGISKENYSRLLNARLAYVVNQTKFKDSTLQVDSSLLANLASASSDNGAIRDLLSATTAIADGKEADVRALLENLDKSVKEVKDISSQFTSLDNARIISNLATGTRLAQLSNPYSNDLALASAIKNLEKAKFAEAGNNENGASALSSVIREYSSRFDSKNNVWGSVLSGKLVSKKGINPTSFGVSVGYDKVYDSSIFGIYANYTNTFANQEFLKASTNGLSIGLYSRAYTDQNEFDAKLSFSHNTHRYTRSQSKEVKLPDATTSAVAPVNTDSRVNPAINVASSAAEFNGFGLSADLAYGHVADLGDSSYIKPLVGLNFQYNKSNSFKEKLADATKGNAVLLQFSDSTSRILTARVGAEFRKYVNEKAYVYATPALEYDIVNNLNQAQVKIQGASDNIKFDKTKSKKSLYGSLSIGGDFSISEKLSANINGALKVGSAKQYYNGSLGLRYKF